MLGFVKRNACGLVVEHKKIVRDYEIKFLTGPNCVVRSGPPT